MSRPDALSVALTFAGERQRDAEEARVMASKRLAEAESTLASLENYCRDYRTRMSGIALTDISMLMNFRGFISKLELAIESQRAEHALRARDVDAADAAWRETLKRVKSLERLIATRVAQKELIENRREQKQSDEFATRSVHGRTTVI